MRARRVKPTDYEMFLGWQRSRGYPLAPRWMFPKRGWVIDDVACVFLVKTDTKVCYVEHFITNPDASESARLEASDLLVQEIFKEAVNLKCRMVSGNTDLEKVMAIGMRHGFKSNGKPHYSFNKYLPERIVNDEISASV